MKTASTGEVLSDYKCLRFDFCRDKEPYHGFIPLERAIRAQSRGPHKKPTYCSDTCAHASAVASWRASNKKKAAKASAAARKAARTKKKRK